MPPHVVFALAARTKLAQRLAAQLAVGATTESATMNAIGLQLQRVFPHATIAIVQDLYNGFRVRPGEYILLVEIADSGVHDGLSVVKLGDPARLQQEIKGWQSCKPHGLKHDIVLMDLQPVPNAAEPAALLYSDAEQLIGVDRTQTLESAMLEAVLFGEPEVPSVADVLFQLYERLGLLLYRHSANVNPSREWREAFDVQQLDKNLLANLELWHAEDSVPFLESADLDSRTQHAPNMLLYRNPVGLFQHILQEKWPELMIPQLLRGRSHGDLHGRNVLVGRVGSRVLWPAVYDYGSMSQTNWIGLDFVKLETEFKIRVYPKLFRETRVGEAFRFEERLFQALESSRRSSYWPALPENATPEDRCFWLILQLRRCAMSHLSQQGRSRLWLMEYYFLLAMYGLNAARFENLEPLEVKFASLSAGCAAARFLPIPNELRLL